METGAVLSTAFQLRLQRGETGLSVRVASKCTPQAAAATMPGAKGLVSLHVGRIRNLGLEVEPDLADETHAEIIGLPVDATAVAEASYLAEQLASQSRIVPLPA